MSFLILTNQSTVSRRISTNESVPLYPRAGEACSFPYVYPDCKVMKKKGKCKADPGIVPLEYHGCYKEATDNPWCYTKTYHNRSQILGEWG